MEIILKEDIAKLGLQERYRNSEKSGYGRNYLIPTW